MGEKHQKILSRGGKAEGMVLSESARYCAACQGTHTCYIVRWPDGTITKPCTAGVGLRNGRLIIL